MPLNDSIPITLAAGQLGTYTQGAYRGITVRETAGAAAIVKIFDNTSGAGVLLGVYGLAALQSIDTSSLNGRAITKGLFAVITGTVEGSVFIS